MGIPKFLGKWLYELVKRRRLRGIRFEILPKNVVSLSFDLNDLIHTARGIVYGTSEGTTPEYLASLSALSEEMKNKRLMQTIGILIHDTVMAVAPTKAVIIAVDGPANLAKIKQQRGRRYMSSSEEHKDDPDSCSVTPGTPFMMELNEYLKSFLKKHRHDFPRHLYYSSHLDPGEGEHKIMSLLRTGKFSVKNSAGNEVGFHVIYGLDADLAILSLINPQKNIVLVRRSLDSILSIEGIKKMLIDDAPPPLKETVVKDFVAMISLLGNDFLPHGPLHNSMFEQVEALRNAYHNQKIPLTLTEDKVSVINFRALAGVISYLPQKEADLLAIEVSKRRDNPDKYIPSVYDALSTVEMTNKMGEPYKVLDYSLFRSAWYNREFGFRGNGIPGMKDTFATPAMIKEMCMEYIKGLSWVFRYYQTIHTDHLWLYPFNHCPLTVDLASIMLSLDVNHGVSLNEQLTKKFVLPYGPVEQLLMVIPYTHRHNLPSFFQEIYDNKSDYPDLFPRSFYIEDDGLEKEDAFLRVPIVSPFDYEKILNITKGFKHLLGRFDPEKIISIPTTEEDNLRYQSAVRTGKDKYYKERKRSVREKREVELQNRMLYYRPGESRGRGRGRGDGRGRGRGDGRSRGRTSAPLPKGDNPYTPNDRTQGRSQFKWIKRDK